MRCYDKRNQKKYHYTGAGDPEESGRGAADILDGYTNLTETEKADILAMVMPGKGQPLEGILIPGGGGGADLDVITATAPDVRKNKVIVDKDGEPLAGVMNEQAGGTFMPGTSDRVLVPANTFVTSAIIMKGDPNLVAGNIKKDVPIFGVIGSKIMLPMAA